MTAPLPESGCNGRGRLLYLITSWLGALCFFTLPALILLYDGDPLTAAISGYASIAVFTGAVAARYEVLRFRFPLLQLCANIALAGVVAMVFFLIFLLLYHL